MATHREKREVEPEVGKERVEAAITALDKLLATVPEVSVQQLVFPCW